MVVLELSGEHLESSINENILSFNRRLLTHMLYE